MMICSWNQGVFFCEGLDGVGGLRWKVKILLQGMWGSREVRVEMRVENFGEGGVPFTRNVPSFCL